jgi:hypothetical protein
MNNRLIDNVVGDENGINSQSKMYLVNKLQFSLFASDKTAFGSAVSLA